jgi:hypothetical protein
MISKQNLLAIELLALELKLHTFLDVLERHYNADQPRVPAGNADGGQWAPTGEIQNGQSARRTGKPTEVALSGRLENPKLSHTDGVYFWMCNYRDMLGRRWGFSLPIDRICPATAVAPPVKGY